MTDDEDAAGMRAPIFQPPRLRTEGDRSRPTRLVLLGLYARAYRHVPQARTTLLFYSAGAAAGAICWTVALTVPGPGRYWLWAWA
jgi:hypothetical protein